MKLQFTLNCLESVTIMVQHCNAVHICGFCDSVYDSTMTTNIIYLTDGIFHLIFHIHSLVTKMVYLANNVSALTLIVSCDFRLPL